MREILADRGAGYVAPASVLEAKALDLFAAAGLPEPVRQVPLPGRVDAPGLADLAFVAERVLVELDGRRWHGRDQAFQRDRERDHAAMLAGWLPLRFTARHLDDRPEYTVATVRAALRRTP
jgi:very-short-patch-repair endonuclease